MTNTVEILYRIKRYYRFYPKETIELIISILIIAFIWAFDDGQEKFNPNNWINNFIITLIIVGISFFIHVSVQKIVGLWWGFRIEYHYWIFGLLISVLITMLTKGAFPLMIPGGILVYHMAKQRIGEFRMGLNFFDASIAAIWGPISNILLGMVAETLYWFFPSFTFLHKMYTFNLVFALFMFLPIPNPEVPTPGFMLFFSSRLLYVFYFGALLSYVLLILVFNFYSLIFALILGGIIWFIYNWSFE